jgi:hypothetical protein
MADILAKKVDEVPLDPQDAAWADTTPVNVLTHPQAVTTPSGGGAVGVVEVRALHSDAAFAVRLTWPNPTSETSVALHSFRDACAVMFPAAEGAMPSPFMGGPGQPVLIWQWKPDWEDPAAAAAATESRYPRYMDYYNPANDAENAKFGDKPGPTEHAEVIVAEGFGSVTRVGDPDLEVKSARDGQHTRVVFRRALPVTVPRFVVGAQGAINVAVWDGASGERGARKSVSLSWTPLVLEGQPPVVPHGPGEPQVSPQVVVLGLALLVAGTLFAAGMAQTEEFRKQIEEQKRKPPRQGGEEAAQQIAPGGSP